MFEINGIYSLSDTIVHFDKDYFIYLVNSETKDTVDVGYPNRYTGYYSFIVPTGSYTLTYGSVFYYSQTVDTTITPNHPSVITINVSLRPDPRRPRSAAGSLLDLGDVFDYEAFNMQELSQASTVESILMVVNLNVRDVTDDYDEDDVLYYTVQVIALYNPVDVSYFRHIDDIKVFYNHNDLFYRYTTGQFGSLEEAYEWRDELLRRGYPNDIFVKVVSRREEEYF